MSQTRVPIGVIGIIYESRPNVAVDASSLSLKSGNAIILRGGSESFYSSTAITNSIRKGLKESSLVLGKHSGKHAFNEKLKELGYDFGDNALMELFGRFKDLAD